MPSSLFEYPCFYGQKVVPPLERAEEYFFKQPYRIRRLTPDKPSSVFQSPGFYGRELAPQVVTPILKTGTFVIKNRATSKDLTVYNKQTVYNTTESVGNTDRNFKIKYKKDGNVYDVLAQIGSGSPYLTRQGNAAVLSSTPNPLRFIAVPNEVDWYFISLDVVDPPTVLTAIAYDGRFDTVALQELTPGNKWQMWRFVPVP